MIELRYDNGEQVNINVDDIESVADLPMMPDLIGSKVRTRSGITHNVVNSRESILKAIERDGLVEIDMTPRVSQGGGIDSHKERT